MEKIALLPGGFKPPHAGHYNMAKWLASNTDADTVVVKVGAKERDGITRGMSLQLWDLYRSTDPDPLAKKLTILPSDSNSPVRDVYDFVEKDAPKNSTIYLGMGEKDIDDVRFKNIGKFAEPKGITFETKLVPPQAGGVSGTEMRTYIKKNKFQDFIKYIPDHLSTEQKNEAWAIVIGYTDYSAPKGGTQSSQFEEDIEEMMMGTMNNQEKAKHAKNLKRLKQDTKNQGDQYIEVPNYLKGTLTINESTAIIHDKFVPLEVMDTPELQVQGMMDRDKLEGGMVFPYDNIAKREFHMQDCKMSLDIVFMDNNKINKIDHNCPPCKEDNCPKYSGKADTVLELPGGYCKKHNVNVGDHIGINLYDIPEPEETKNHNRRYVVNEILNELSDREIKMFAMHADILKQLNTPNFKLRFVELQQELEGERLEALEYFWNEFFSNLEDSCEIEDAFNENYPPYKVDQVQKVRYQASDTFTNSPKDAKKMGYSEGTLTKKWWSSIINEILLTEGGAAGHMAHPFNLSNVNSGKDLKNIFSKAAESLNKNPGAVKIDGVNSSIRLVDLKGKKQFAMDRGSKKPLDMKGITKADLEDRFKPGHGMIKVGGEVLDMFNEALPTLENDLKKLGAWEDPNILFNMEYVSGKTNVQDYGSNFIAIHGLNKIESKEVQGKRGPLTKRISTEISYDKSALQSLLDNLAPIAKKNDFEVYGSVPTEMIKNPNFNAALSKTYTIKFNDEEKSQTLDSWLNELTNIPEEDFIFIDVNGTKKKVGAVSKQVYQAILNGGNVDELFGDDKDKAISGFTTYLATEKLGDEVLKVLDSPMGSVENHEGVVIRDEKISNIPFKITGKFILGGMASDF